jgi:hypothetical protein
MRYIKMGKKLVENVEEFNYLGRMITNDERCTQEIKARIAMGKSVFISLHQQIRLKAKEEISEVLHLEHHSVWCRNLDSSGSKLEVPGKFRNVVLEKDGEEKLDRTRK